MTAMRVAYTGFVGGSHSTFRNNFIKLVDVQIGRVDVTKDRCELEFGIPPD